MGTLASLVPLLGLLAGIIIAHFTKSELAPGKKYFILLQHVLASVILGILLWNFGMYIAIISGIVLLSVLWKTRFSHTLEITPILAIPAILNQNTHVPIFLYFIPAGTLHYKEIKKVIIVACVYAAIIIISSLIF